MASRTLLVVGVILYCLHGELEAKRNRVRSHTPNIKSIRDVDKYLKQYGYAEADRTSHHLTRAERKDALRSFQRFNGFKENGKVSKRVLREMGKPRCGDPDLVYVSDSKSRRKRSAAEQKNPFASESGKWGKRFLTWRPSKYSRQLPWSGQRNIFSRAFKAWGDIIPMKFIYTYATPDIDIRFGRYEHGDGWQRAFDGRGMLLAHAYGPGLHKLAGDIHFDEDENWAITKRRHDQKYLFSVMAHEIGHSLGLNHSPVKKALMHPSYKDKDDVMLHWNDIYEAQIRYGRNPSFHRVNYLLEMKRRQKGTTNIQICDVGFDDLTLAGNWLHIVERDRYIYGFKNDSVYKFGRLGLEAGFPKNVHEVYPGAPLKVNAVTYYRRLKKTYIFKQRHVWRYTNFTLDHGYPKRFKTRFTETIRTAFVYSDGSPHDILILLSLRFFWVWNTYSDETEAGYPQFISRYWRKFPRTISAAATLRDGYIYLFKKANKYWKIHPLTRSVIDGYPSPIDLKWLRGKC